MPFVFAPRRSVCWAILLFAVCIARPARGQSLDQAWMLLVENKILEARAAFDSLRQSSDPAVAGAACRGLAETARILGDGGEAAVQTFRAFLHDRDTLMLDAAWINTLPFARSWSGHAMREGYQTLRHLTEKASPFNGEYRAALIHRLVNDGDMRAAQKHRTALGLIDSFLMIGPFENVSGSGYRRVYPPEREIRPDTAYSGKNGARAHWFPYHNASPLGWLFTEHNFDSYNAVLYYFANLNSDRERDVYLGFGASGSFKVMLNDRVVMADSVFRNTGADMFLRTVRLRKGDNKLLVKIGHESSYSNFLIRMVDSSGAPLEGLSVSTSPGDYRVDTTALDGAPASPGVERVKRALRQRIERNPDDHEAALHLMAFYNASELTDAGQRLARRYLRRYPSSSVWHSLYAESLQRGLKYTAASAAHRAAFKYCPLNSLAWEYQLQTLARSAGAREILAFIERSPEQFRGSVSTLMQRFALLVKAGNEAEALTILDTIERKHSDNSAALRLLAGFSANRGGIAKADALLRKLIGHNHASSDAYRERAQLQLKRGKPRAALRTLEKSLSYVPDDPDTYEYLARLSMQRKELDAALDAIDQALRISPASAGLLNLRGAIFKARGNAEAAVAVYRQAIEYQYNNFSAWDQLLPLIGAPSPRSLVTLPDPDTLIAYAKFWDGLDSDNGSILADIKDVFMYPSRCVRERSFLIVYVPTQSAIDRWKEYSIPYNGHYQALDITRAYSRGASGRETPADIDRNQVVFKALRPGDFIVLEYQFRNYYTGDMARHVWGEYDFSLPYPVFRSKLRLVSPARDTIPWRIDGDSTSVSVRETAGFRVASFRRDPYQMPPTESFTLLDPPWHDRVAYSTMAGWGDVVQWYYNLTDNKLGQTVELRQIADSLFAGATTRHDTVAAAHNFITGAIRYSFVPFRQSAWVPQPAREVLASRIGDCKDMSALGKSFLDYAGIPAWLTLVNTRDRNSLYPSYIGPNFNHCILAYESTDGSLRYLDPTDNNLSCGNLPRMDQQSLALVIRPGVDSLTRLPLDSAEDRLTRRKITATIDTGGGMRVSVHTTRTGVAAGRLRSSYRFLSPSERVKHLQRVLVEDFPSARVDTLWFGGLDTLTDTLRYYYEYHAANAANFSGNAAVVPVNLPDRIEGRHYPADDSRDYDIDLANAWFAVGDFDIEGTVVFPDQWRLITSPAPVTKNSEYGGYELSFTVSDTSVGFRRRARFRFDKPIRIEQSDKPRAFLSRIARADNVLLMFFTRSQDF
jgi:tetratricopeptide (TPR) repeat protein